MALLRCWLCLLGVILLGVPAHGVADVPPRTTAPTSPLSTREDAGKLSMPPAASSSPAAPPSPLSLDLLKLPAGAVLVLCEEAREALRLIPKFVVLSPQEYQDLHKQIEQLKAQLEG